MSHLSEPSVFDILNIFHHHWFPSRDWLISFIASAQKTEVGNIFWVEFDPKGHTHLIHSTLALVPHDVPAAKVKQVMFVYILEVLNQDSPAA